MIALRERVYRALAGDDLRRSDGVCRLPPEWLVLVVNNFCNLRCRMCDVGTGQSDSVFFGHLVGTSPRNMEPALLEVVLEQAAAFAWKPRVGLAYTEPLIHPRILELCRAIVGRGFTCSITTNGFLLPRLAAALVEIGVDEITVSADGPAAVHDEVRGRAGSFEALYRGVEAVNRARAASRARRPRVSFSYTLTDLNAAHLLAFAREIEPLRPEVLNVSHLNYVSAEMASAHNALFGAELPVAPSNVSGMDPGAVDLAALWASLEELKAYARSRADFPRLSIVPDFPSPEGLEVFYRQPLRFVGGRTCTDPWRMLMVRTDGTVIPAHGRCYEVPVGNVGQAPLAELWNAAAYRRFRQRLQEAGGSFPACSRCCGVIGKPVASGI
jgi:MoaA/NifB/PqqE/SkfB family radical SAM enzyme